MLPLLLVISGQNDASTALRLELSASGFKAYYVDTLASALGVITQWHFDAALLDMRALDLQVMEIIRGLRGRVSHIPILAVLQSDNEELLLKVLGAGASQVLPPDVSTRVIAAQLRRWAEVSRPQERDESSPVQVGPLWLDPRRAAASVDGVELKLTATEFEVLLLLAAAGGDLVHRSTISRTLRFISDGDRGRSGDMHICRIRRKLRAAGENGLMLLTVFGQGYQLRYVAPRGSTTGHALVEWSV